MTAPLSVVPSDLIYCVRRVSERENPFEKRYFRFPVILCFSYNLFLSLLLLSLSLSSQGFLRLNPVGLLLD
jgi:hypothetical protein